jgi:site-specific recombinase XerC
MLAPDDVASDIAQQQGAKGPKMDDLIVVEKPAQWHKLKQLVLDSVSSPITKRVYNMALDEFLAWFQQAPRPGFTKATVSAWRVSLEERRLRLSSIIIRMSAIRKLAAEAADNGLLAPELAAGIARVKSAKSEVAALTFSHIQQRDGRWCIVDLVGKHGRVRTG